MQLQPVHADHGEAARPAARLSCVSNVTQLMCQAWGTVLLPEVHGRLPVRTGNFPLSSAKAACASTACKTTRSPENLEPFAVKRRVFADVQVDLLKFRAAAGAPAGHPSISSIDSIDSIDGLAFPGVRESDEEMDKFLADLYASRSPL